MSIWVFGMQTCLYLLLRTFLWPEKGDLVFLGGYTVVQVKMIVELKG